MLLILSMHAIIFIRNHQKIYTWYLQILYVYIIYQCVCMYKLWQREINKLDFITVCARLPMSSWTESWTGASNSSSWAWELKKHPANKVSVTNNTTNTTSIYIFTQTLDKNTGLLTIHMLRSRHFVITVISKLSDWECYIPTAPLSTT